VTRNIVMKNKKDRIIALSATMKQKNGRKISFIAKKKMI